MDWDWWNRRDRRGRVHPVAFPEITVYPKIGTEYFVH